MKEGGRKTKDDQERGGAKEGRERMKEGEGR